MAVFSKDTFTGEADGTNLASHVADDGGTWAKHIATSSGASWLMSAAGRAYGSVQNFSVAASASYLASGIPTSDEFDIAATWHFKSHLTDPYNGILFRYHPTNYSGYRLEYRGHSVFRYWILLKVTSGSGEDVGDTTWAQEPTADSDTDVLVECRNGGIAVKFDGVTRITSADTTFLGSNQRRMGLWSYGDSISTPTTGYHVDQFIAADPGEAVLDGGGGSTKVLLSSSGGSTKVRFFAGS